MTQVKPPFRADHVGSFLRPAALLDARAKYRAGEIDAGELRAVEDVAIRDVIQFQEGLGVVSKKVVHALPRCDAADA
jgi:5-methyltetrahydropteroyltriglutamate--homocysteine methyltransferase